MTNRRVFLILDSLIATGALLSIAWYFLLGSLTQSPAQSFLGKSLGIYYPMADIALLSYTIFLLLREHGSEYHVNARRVSLFLVGVGLSIYAISDFAFNVLQNMGLPVDATWIDAGWPLGMMTLGLAAYFRRFLPGKARVNIIEDQNKRYATQASFSFSQSLPYILLFVLFFVLIINVLSYDPLQEYIRPVLIIATFVVIILVVIRQIITARDNIRLVKEQASTLLQLEQVYQDIEKRQVDLETGVSHLKEVQTRLANGDVRARAQILNGDLWPLASGLNIMADRMMRSEQRQRYAQSLLKAISDLNLALEQKQRDNRVPFVLPASCLDAPLELNHLIQIIGLKPEQRAISGSLSTSQPVRYTTTPTSAPPLTTTGHKYPQPHRVSLHADEQIFSD